MSRANSGRDAAGRAAKLAADNAHKSEERARKAAQKETTYTEQTPRAAQILRALDALAERKAGQTFVDSQRLRTLYVLERFFARLAQSELSDTFILKGALATNLYVPNAFRTTNDGDLQAYGNYTPETMKATITTLCQIPFDDAMRFGTDEMKVKDAGKTRGYAGFAIKMDSWVGTIHVPFSLDICFGEVVHPKAATLPYPVLLTEDVEIGTSLQLRVYPLETIFAEKLQVIVHMGIANSRLKDYFDLHSLIQSCEIDGATLRDAIRGTFAHRGEVIPTETPTGLTDEFSLNKTSKREWVRFLRSVSLNQSLDLKEAVDAIWAMVEPLAIAATRDELFDRIWKDGKWRVAPQGASDTVAESQTPV